jgi:hypothetical protein
MILSSILGAFINQPRIRETLAVDRFDEAVNKGAKGALHREMVSQLYRPVFCSEMPKSRACVASTAKDR